MTRLLLFGLALAIAGCDSIDDAIKERAPAARATLAKIPAVAADLKTRPLATKNEPFTLADKPLVSRADNATAMIVFYEDLEKLGELGNVALRAPGTEHLSECASFLDHKTYPWDPNDPTRWTQYVAGYEVKERLGECGRIKTLFVIRTVAYAPATHARLEKTAAPAIMDAGAPKADAGDAGTDAAAVVVSGVSAASCNAAGYRCVYEPGYVKAEIHAFTLDPVAHAGVVVVEADSGTSHDVYYDPSDDFYKQELLKNFKNALSHTGEPALSDWVPTAAGR